MWLINTTTLDLEYFAVPERAPRYAVLSHTWGDEELSFAEFRSVNDSVKRKRGYKKIKKTCELARQSGIPYAWVDTCCIDKSSSAELTEAINSMYNYYRQSQICYAYIDDWMPGVDWCDLVALGETPKTEPEPEPALEHAAQPLPLRWFTRGWTLQELIAPDKVQFYDGSWAPKGFKSDYDVMPHLSRITRIASQILKDGDEKSLSRICLGQRMSWAAHRNTSRVEDAAYCLMGIFQINMPLLYGEGGRAFLRFQQEIIKTTTDLSLFAWTPEKHGWVDIFSPHPRYFAGLDTCSLARTQFSQTNEIAVTNKGLRIYTAPFILPENIRTDSGELYLDLGCTTGVETTNHRYLTLVAYPGDLYVRQYYSEVWTDLNLRRALRSEPRALYIAIHPNPGAILDYRAPRMQTNSKMLSEKNPLVAELYKLRHLASWPPSCRVVKEGTELLWFMDIAKSSWFIGYIKVDVVVDPGLKGQEQEPEPIDHMIAVCFKKERVGAGKTWFLRGKSAHGFIERANRAEELFPSIAQAELSTYMIQLQDDGLLLQHVDVWDKVRMRGLRVYAEEIQLFLVNPIRITLGEAYP